MLTSARSSLAMAIRPAIIAVGLIGLGWTVNADPAWQDAVDETVAAACATRGLTAKYPIVVRPMAEFEGGYTAGLGSVVWEDHHAEQWRNGWCAVGVYCAKPPTTSASDAEDPRSPLEGPSGLFDAERNVLFVRSVDSLAARGTVAHEATHALQYQNFPSLLAIRSWFNRDLSAAVNAATEGDAHIIGASLDATKRLDICLMDPAKPGAAAARLWQWHPQAVWAHEAFPHVFGPEMALRRWLDAGSAGADDLLRNPPLSTREVLNPELPGTVDFIALPDDLLTAALAKRDCAVGLTNTVGALGIWGLLAEHGEADASDTVAPALVDHWLGDRFAHGSCPGAGDDELAWVIRWRTAHAASQFVERYRAIAESVAAVGGVLTAPPMPFQHERTVVVVTPGVQDTVAALAEARVRTFTRFRDWIASGCFPQSECYIDTPPAETDGSHLCSQKAGQEPSAGEREGPAPRMEEPSAGEREGPAPRMEEPSAGEREGPAPRMEEPSAGEREGLALAWKNPQRGSAKDLPLVQKEPVSIKWLDRVRKTRSSAAERDDLQTAADTLSDFCVANWLDNEDIALACAAASSGVRNWLQRDCIGSPAPESSPPANIEAEATETVSELWPKFPKRFGIPLAERRAASNGLAGLLALNHRATVIHVGHLPTVRRPRGHHSPATPKIGDVGMRSGGQPRTWRTRHMDLSFGAWIDRQRAGTASLPVELARRSARPPALRRARRLDLADAMGERGVGPPTRIAVAA